MSIERIVDKKGVRYVSFDVLEETGLVKHGFMTRIGGVSSGCFDSLNLSYTRGDDEGAVTENFKRAAAALDSAVDNIVLGNQTHTSNIRRVTRADAGKGVVCPLDYSDIDGLITDEPGLLLGTTHADCAPVFLLDPEKKAVGLLHAGWRGTAGMIAAKGVAKMAEEFGTDPAQLIAVIGPCICGSCYEIGYEVAVQMMQIFEGECFALKKKTNCKFTLDLKRANKRILFEAGLRENNIIASGLCTFEREELFFSHRRMGDKRGQNMAFIGLA